METNQILRSAQEAQTLLTDLLAAFKTLPQTEQAKELVKDFERYTSITPANSAQAIGWALQAFTEYVTYSLTVYKHAEYKNHPIAHPPIAPAANTVTCRYCLTEVDAAHTITDIYTHTVSCGYCGGSLDKQEQEAIRPK